jgi:hypothetical protein
MCCHARDARVASLVGGAEKLKRMPEVPHGPAQILWSRRISDTLVGLTQQKDVSVAESAARRKERAHHRVTVGGADDTLCLRAISGREAIEPRLTTHSTPVIPRAGPAAEIRE